MFRYMSFLFLIVSCFPATRAGWAAQAVADLPPGYVVGGRIALKPAKDGFEGAVELLTDGRIVPAQAGALMQFYFVGDALADARLARLVELGPLMPAILRLLDRQGAVLDQRELESPFAKLEPAAGPRALGDHAALSITRGGFGSVLEEMTAFLAFRGGGIRPAVFADPQSGETGTLELARGAKTDWRADPKIQNGDLLQVVCKPGSGAESGFVERFLRYRPEGGRWTRMVSERLGYCEWEDFPPLEAFP
jgi:hypothetical protein